MKITASTLALLAVTLGASASQEGRAWLTSGIEMNEESGIPIPKADSCEVPEAKLGKALLLLRRRTHFALEAQKARSLVGSCIHASDGKTPYLVRAVYGHRGTGSYFVRHVGNDLLVAHGSLGHYATYTKSALVVNLPFKPAHVFVKAGIDE